MENEYWFDIHSEPGKDGTQWFTMYWWVTNIGPFGDYRGWKGQEFLSYMKPKVKEAEERGYVVKYGIPPNFKKL